jgi:hypothetical protein
MIGGQWAPGLSTGHPVKQVRGLLEEIVVAKRGFRDTTPRIRLGDGNIGGHMLLIAALVFLVLGHPLAALFCVVVYLIFN